MKTLSDLANEEVIESEDIEEARIVLLSLIDKANAAEIDGERREPLIHRLNVLSSALKHVGWQDTITRQDAVGSYKEALFVIRDYPPLIEYYERMEQARNHQ